MFSNWSPTSSPLQTHDVQIVEVFRKTSLSGANADGVVVLTGYGFVGVAGHSRKLPEGSEFVRIKFPMFEIPENVCQL